MFYALWLHSFNTLRIHLSRDLLLLDILIFVKIIKEMILCVALRNASGLDSRLSLIWKGRGGGGRSPPPPTHTPYRDIPIGTFSLHDVYYLTFPVREWPLGTWFNGPFEPFQILGG